MKPSDQGNRAEGPGAYRFHGRGTHQLTAEFAIVAFLVVQLLLPIAGLAWRGPSFLTGRGLDGTTAARFGWQVFSVAPSTPNTWVLTLDDGTFRTVDSVDEFGLFRGRMHYSAGLVEAVCRLDPGALSVTHTLGRFPC